MKEGLGQIQIDFAATCRGDNPERKLIFENHHQQAGLRIVFGELLGPGGSGDTGHGAEPQL